jgi:anti-sigma regulatory factor (Ser/Thr protein kinase)
LHLEKQQAETIGYIVSELVGNVIEHASCEHGAIICAQYYPKSNSIRIGIADTGVGVRTTITRSHAAATDLDALRLALRPGVTGTTRREGGTDQNAGAGLFFIKAIASTNRDFFIIYSGSGFYKLLKKKDMASVILRSDPFIDRHSKSDSFPHWQGTVVGVDITLAQTRVFSQLLAAIRETYSKDVREKKKQRYKRPRFA